MAGRKPVEQLSYCSQISNFWKSHDYLTKHSYAFGMKSRNFTLISRSLPSLCTYMPNTSLNVCLLSKILVKCFDIGQIKSPFYLILKFANQEYFYYLSRPQRWMVAIFSSFTLGTKAQTDQNFVC